MHAAALARTLLVLEYVRWSFFGKYLARVCVRVCAKTCCVHNAA
jgi:hypothetical protein